MASSYHTSKLSDQVHRVLHIVLFAIILIVFRLWYLAVILQEEKREEGLKPRHKTVVETAKRGTITDRFGLPLAVNKIEYQASILYADLRQIPGIKWEYDEKGKRKKIFERRDYIKKLSLFLAKELKLNAARIEDLIHAKAALYFHIPFVIKDSLTEEEYYRLRLASKDWHGLEIRKVPKRNYPNRRLAGEVVGYMGAISKEEHEKILKEIQWLKEILVQKETGSLEEEIPAPYTSFEEMEIRLQLLEEKSYTLHDLIGKTGVEAKFEEDLRGNRGKNHFSVDAKGRVLHSLPGSLPPLTGKRVQLTISSELQDYAEKLLIQNESIREVLVTPLEGKKKTFRAEKEPWMKGSAIVAMDPNTSEVLALASYPRFDPNDFIPSTDLQEKKQKKEKIERWFELDSYIGALWDQQRPFEREIYDFFSHQTMDEKKWLTWNQYLNLILPKDSPIGTLFQKQNTLEKIYQFQKNLEKFITLSEQTDLHFLLNYVYSDEGHTPYDTTISAMQRIHLNKMLEEKKREILACKKELDPFFSSLSFHYDKVLFSDLCLLQMDISRFSSSLIKKIGHLTLEEYRKASKEFFSFEEEVKKEVQKFFHNNYFAAWRKENEKMFLKEKRNEEKAKKRYTQPYIDYLDQKEKELFHLFWKKHHLSFLTFCFFEDKKNLFFPLSSYEEISPYLYDLDEYRKKNKKNPSFLFLKKIISSLDPYLTERFFTSFRKYEELVRPLYGRYPSLKKKKKYSLEKDLASAFYPKYGFGHARSHAFRQAATQGSIFKLITAYEALYQKYQKQKKLEDLNPLTMVDQIFKKGDQWFVGYREDGTAIAQNYKGGRLPRSHTSMMGTIDLVKAIERSSNPYFSLLALEHMKNPKDLLEAAKKFSYGQKTGIDLTSEISGLLPKNVDIDPTELYAFAIGQAAFTATPLQTAVMLSSLANGGKVFKPKIVQKKIQVYSEKDSIEEEIPSITHNVVFLPDAIRNILFIGMEKMVKRSQKIHKESLLKMYEKQKFVAKDFFNTKSKFIGKTSTTEVVETIDLDSSSGKNIYSHVWFGGIWFKEEDENTVVIHDQFGKPELVVIVYLKYGGYGKEAAPIAVQIAKKWKEIQKKRMS